MSKIIVLNRVKTMLQVIVLFSLFVAITCSIFHKKQTIIEPAHVRISDESRIDNSKIRHIFEEILLKGLVDKGSGWLTIGAIDNSNAGDFKFPSPDYYIAFDIMDYSIVEIEKGIEKLLVSIKIIRISDQKILHSYVESAIGKDVEKVCQTIVNNTIDSIVDSLRRMQKREIRFDVPDMPLEPEDSL